MSSVRGRGTRGRGRGSTQTAPSSGRGASSTRGRVFTNAAPRGNGNTRGGLGDASRPRAPRAPLGSSRGRGDGSSRQTLQTGASGAAQSRGSWQDRYQALTTARERERTNSISQGLIADPDKPRALSEAITPVGTCQDMCAEYERVQRVVQKDVWPEETDPNQSVFATTEKEPDESRMVKKFRRAAAGLEEQLPSDLRPPQVLKQTCDYLFNEVVGHASTLAQVHLFVWDRTRAIRNDFSIQQITRPSDLRIAIECYERIARFHIVSLHQLALPDKPYPRYDAQQEREQLDRTLLSLMQYYDDSRGRIELPNEAEFRAYCVLFQLQDPTPDLEDRVQTWPRDIVQNARVQKAVEVYMAACNVMDAQGPLKPRTSHLIARQDWQRFWTLVASKEVSYLMACVAEIYFNLVRRTVLNALFRTFRGNPAQATPDWTVDMLCNLLAFDDGDDVYTYCTQFGFDFKTRDDGQQYLDLTSVRGRSLPEHTTGLRKQLKTSLVEDKRFGRTLPAVINGLAVRQAQDAKMMDPEEDEGMEDIAEDENRGGVGMDEMVETSNDVVDDEDSLFIPEEKSVTNDAKVETKSIFNVPSSGFTFGKPSGAAAQPSISAQAQDSSKVNALGLPHAQVSPFSKAATTNGNANTATKSIFGFPPSIEPGTSAQAKSTSNLFTPSKSFVDQSSPFGTQPSAAPAKPAFSFAQPAKPAIQETNTERKTEFAPSPTLFPPQPESKPAAPELPKNPFTFGQAAGPPAPPALSFINNQPANDQQPETKASQPHFTTSPTSPTLNPINPATTSSSLNTAVKRPSFSIDTKPKKPSPLANSITASEDNSAIASDAPVNVNGNKLVNELFPARQSQVTKSDVSESKSKAPSQSSQDTPDVDFDAIISRIAWELTTDQHAGFLKQYVEWAISHTITEAQEQVIAERLNKEADDWRHFVLESKYGKRWRDLFWQRRRAKAGRERRERRQKRLQERGSQGVEDGSLVDDQSVGGSSRAGSVLGIGVADFRSRQEMVDSKFKQTLGGRSWSRPEPSDRETLAGSKRPASSHGADTSTSTRVPAHKRMKSTSHVDDRGRVTKPTAASHSSADILKRSSFLGFSMSRDGAGVSNKNTTTSNYFKLKAMGVSRADEASGLRGLKRQRSGSLQQLSQTPPPAIRASSLFGSSPEQSVSKALMPPPSSAPSRTSKTREDDEALFARLRAARENLKESTSYFTADADKISTHGQSMSPPSSNESPSMAKARAEARLRASQPPSDRDVPAYRLRESKFVPREQYGRAIERAREMRESRSRDTSRPESRLEDNQKQAASTPAATTQSPVDTRPTTETAIDNLATHAQGTNGFLPAINAPEQASAFTELSSKHFSVQPHGPFSFANHTTQMSSQNPFLQASVPDSVDHVDSQPMFGVKHVSSTNDGAQDHTIQPSQINQSLAHTFGAPSSFGHNAFQALPHSPPPPQQDSYLQSQAISLMSEDEEDERAEGGLMAPLATHQQRHVALEVGEPDEELLDEDSDGDELQNSYGHANPYAVLANQAGDGEPDEDQDEDSQGWDSQVDEQANADDDQVEDDSSEDEETGPNGYEYGDEDQEAVDGDIDDDDTEIDEEDEEDEDEEEGYQYEHVRSRHWQHQAVGDPWNAQPEKDAALQVVGNTVEEAIELSD